MSYHESVGGLGADGDVTNVQLALDDKNTVQAAAAQAARDKQNVSVRLTDGSTVTVTPTGAVVAGGGGSVGASLGVGAILLAVAVGYVVFRKS